MRWLVGWSSAVGGASAVTETARPRVVPVGGQLLWGDPDPLWAVGDWRPDEVRVIEADPARGGSNYPYRTYRNGSNLIDHRAGTTPRQRRGDPGGGRRAG